MAPVGDVEPNGGLAYQQVDVELQTVGQAPGNLSRVDLSFRTIAFYEESSRQWVQVSFTRNVSLVFDEDPSAYLATITLPVGSYSKIWGSLGSVEVWEGDSGRPAVPVATRCQVPVSMVLDGGDQRPVLTLFVFPEDAFVKQDETWFVQPAFSGSFSEDSGAGEGSQGSPRFTRPQCDVDD